MAKIYTVKSTDKKKKSLDEALLSAQGDIVEVPEAALCLHVAGTIEAKGDQCDAEKK